MLCLLRRGTKGHFPDAPVGIPKERILECNEVPEGTWVKCYSPEGNYSILVAESVSKIQEQIKQ
jgi:hypothetical protein